MALLKPGSRKEKRVLLKFEVYVCMYVDDAESRFGSWLCGPAQRSPYVLTAQHQATRARASQAVADPAPMASGPFATAAQWTGVPQLNARLD